jgi:lantibiotic modifying enzyme
LGTSQYRDTSGATRFTHGTIGPALYGGVSGIALFLAETSAKTHTPEFGDAAVSAISYAMSRMHSISARTRFGFFTGEAGVAYAASRIGELVDRPEIVRRSRSILRRLARESTAESILDIISGAAGSAPVIVRLADGWRDEQLRRFARRLGSRVVARACKRLDGWSWGSDATGFESARNLTGFAHGAAGFGWSLLELHRALGDQSFERGAEQAFRYERRWFQKDHQNWPDFRETRSAKRAPSRVAWCHGAPGIGMSRLAAARVHGVERYRVELAAAIQSSIAVLGSSLDHFDCSLCHGMLGIAEFLLMAANIPSGTKAASTALDFATSRADDYVDRPGDWPCGLHRGQNPSLMLGLAGIGHFYLRLAFPDVPSVLLPGSTTDEAHSVRHRPASRLRPKRAESTAH